MKIRKHFILLFMCLALPLVGQAQSAHWAITPSYQSVTRFGPNLFKVKTYASTGICDSDEKWVVSLAMDSITNITNGYALAMTKKKDKYLIVYIIRENGTREAVKDEVYASEYPYFVDDRCPVMTKKGKYGYLDPSGQLVIPCNYTAALPFKGGVAHVSKAKGGFSGLLDKIRGKKSGTAYEVGKDGKIVKGMKGGNYLEIDKSGNTIRSIENVEEVLDLDNVNKPFVGTPDPVYTRFREGRGYGYAMNGNVILPSQFEEGETAIDGCAIVMVDHLFGVVKFNTATVSCKVSESGGKLKVTADLPTIWENKTAKITRIVNDAARKEYELAGTGSERTLDMSVDKENGKRVYELTCDKLVLWRSLNKVEDRSKSGGGKGQSDGISVSAPGSIKANKKGVCAVPIKVTNRGSSARTISISLSTGQKSSLQVAAGKSGSVTVNVPVTKKTSCTITARGGGASSSCTVTLNPAIVL